MEGALCGLLLLGGFAGKLHGLPGIGHLAAHLVVPEGPAVKEGSDDAANQNVNSGVHNEAPLYLASASGPLVRRRLPLNGGKQLF